MNTIAVNRKTSATLVADTIDGAVRVSELVPERGALYRFVVDDIDEKQAKGGLRALTQRVADAGGSVELVNRSALQREETKKSAAPDVNVVGEFDPPLSEHLVPARKGNSASLEWWHSVQEFAMGSLHMQKMLVLWGGTGVGKSMALRRLASMVRGRKEADRVPVMHVSAADLIDNDGKHGEFDVALESLARFAATSPQDKRALLLVDDLDTVLDVQRRRRIVTVLAGASKRLRCIAVTDNWFSRESLIMRKRPLSLSFTMMHIGPAHSHSLAKYLERRFPVLRSDGALSCAIAEESRGDVRAALLRASQVTSSARKASTAQDTAQATDVPRTVLLLAAIKGDARASSEALRLRSVRKRLRDEQYEQKPQDAAELLYANAPRLAESNNAFMERNASSAGAMRALADACEQMSLGAQYSDSRMQNSYSGADAHDTDLSLANELSVGNVGVALASATRGFGGFRSAGRMDFPLKRLAARTARVKQSGGFERAEQLAVTMPPELRHARQLIAALRQSKPGAALRALRRKHEDWDIAEFALALHAYALVVRKDSDPEVPDVEQIERLMSRGAAAASKAAPIKKRKVKRDGAPTDAKRARRKYTRRSATAGTMSVDKMFASLRASQQ